MRLHPAVLMKLYLMTPDFSFPVSVPQLVSLTLDGLTGVSQDHMRGRFQTSANHMMLNINLWSTLVLGLGEPAVVAANLGRCDVVAEPPLL